MATTIYSEGLLRYDEALQLADTSGVPPSYIERNQPATDLRAENKATIYAFKNRRHPVFLLPHNCHRLRMTARRSSRVAQQTEITERTITHSNKQPGE